MLLESVSLFSVSVVSETDGLKRGGAETMNIIRKLGIAKHPKTDNKQ